MRFILLAFVTFLASHAEESRYKVGEKLYVSKGCSGCHGIQAEGMGANPFLANKPKGFLTYKLKRFREGIADTQPQETMIGFALGLSDEQIDALTTYLSDYVDVEREKYNPSYETWGDGGS